MSTSSTPSASPVVKIAMAGAGILATMTAQKVLERGWSAVFDEVAPTDKAAKESAKNAKAERKQAKKDGASRDELAQISNPMDEVPIWKVLLWTALSGIAIQGAKLLAQRVAGRGAHRLIHRRPSSNRG